MSLEAAVPLITGLASAFIHPSQSTQQVTPASTTQQAIPSWLLPLYQNSANFLLNNLGNPFAYPGQTQVGMSPLSQQAYSDIGSLAQITPLAGGELGADITGAYTDPTQNPVVQNMVAALYNQFGPNSVDMQNRLRQLHGNFNMIDPSAGAEGYSGAASAEGNLFGTQAANLSSQIANLLQTVYGQERGIQSNATTSALNIPGLEQTQGNVPTTLEQNNITTNLQQWADQVKNMFGVPTAVFPAIANAFYPQSYIPQYGPNPAGAIGSGLESLINSPNNSPVYTPSFSPTYAPSAPTDSPSDPLNYMPGPSTPASPPMYPDTTSVDSSGLQGY